MKKILLTASALATAAALSTAAQAADMAPAPSAYDWSGFYFGLNAGVAWNNSELENDFRYTGEGVNIDGDPDIEITPAAINSALGALGDRVDVGSDEAVFTGGAAVGYNWQHESLVLGVEADINYAGFGDDNSRDVSDELSALLNEDISGTAETSFDANWFGTLRGRLGFAADNLLIYGTGGLAFGHMEASVEIDGTDTDNCAPDCWSGSYSGSTESTNWGWTVGAGMEYGIDNWSLGVEYLYVDLGSAEWDGDFKGRLDDQDAAVFADIEGDGEIDYQFSVVRATAKIRF